MNKTIPRWLAAAGAALLLADPALAADADRGRELAGTCRVCHGLDGVGTNPTVPNIGGQSAMYLVKALQDFRDGRRENEQMTIMAEGLSDQDIADLAAWYASIKATFEIPEG
jgi:cytochrome c553